MILQKFFNQKSNTIICGKINMKKIQLNAVLNSHNLIHLVTFPARIANNSSSAIDNVFIDRSDLTNCDIIPSIHGLCDHNA